MAGRLYIDFCGEEHVLEVGQTLTFGRAGDLVVDDNPYLHRVLGRFGHRDGHWWLDNEGSAIVLNLFDRTGPTSAVIAPGSTSVLGMAEFGCGFTAGPCRYELDGAVEDVASSGVEVGPQSDPDGMRTLDWGVVDLNADQRLLLVELAERCLSDPGASPAELPAKRASARRLGWSLSKYNRKLDHLCAKLDRAGVSGLYGTDGLQALDRRRRLVDHALGHDLVTQADLGLLEGLPTA